MVTKTDRALKALADQDAPGPLNHRLESAIDATTHDVLVAMAAELGGQGARSKAARLLIQKGAAAVLAERAPRA